MTLGEKINQANAEALKRILGAQPTLVGMGTAGEDIPGMTKKTILHAGPPVTWDKMCGPVRGAIIGGLIYEGLASNKEEAEKLAASGEITFDSCHHHNGPDFGKYIFHYDYKAQQTGFIQPYADSPMDNEQPCIDAEN